MLVIFLTKWHFLSERSWSWNQKTRYWENGKDRGLDNKEKIILVSYTRKIFSWNVFQEWVFWHCNLDDNFETKHNKSPKKVGFRNITRSTCIYVDFFRLQTQKGHKSIDNLTKVIHTKSLKKVWEMDTQYDATNRDSGLFTWEG